MKVNYISNGTGRDSYVYGNNGGFTNKYTNPNFGSMLR